MPLLAYKSKLSDAEERLMEAKNLKEEVPEITYPEPPAAPILKKPGLFNKAKILATNEELTAQYQEQLELYKKDIESCKLEEKRAKEEAMAKKANEVAKAENAVEEAKSALKKAQKESLSPDTPAKTLHASIENEICEAEKLLKQTLECRNKLYSYDIIFEKYHNIVAISTFYEYLMSGRCDSLEGANGAYNIYENEIRANLIISQLSTVIKQLEDIKQSQYMIYSEMQKVNQGLSTLNGKMDRAISSLKTVEHNTELTAYNTAVTAYYAKKNVELTNALGYLIAMK